MKIALIGTGNVAYHLAKRLDQSGVPPGFIVSRTKPKGQDFVKSLRLNAQIISPTDLAEQQLDFVLIAVPDRSIRSVAETCRPGEEAILLHTSGAQSMDILSGKGTGYGVLYPFQTFSRQKPVDFNEIPIFIEGDSTETEVKIARLASLLGPKVRTINSGQRLKMHLAAVFACNFSNSLFSIAESILDDADLELKDLEHLIRETVDKALSLSPEKAQTGPAIRKDTEVIRKHLSGLKDEDLRKLYELHTRLIQKQRG